MLNETMKAGQPMFVMHLKGGYLWLAGTALVYERTAGGHDLAAVPKRPYLALQPVKWHHVLQYTIRPDQGGKGIWSIEQSDTVVRWRLTKEKFEALISVCKHFTHRRDVQPQPRHVVSHRFGVLLEIVHLPGVAAMREKPSQH